jgi:hypothetical protein
LPCPFNIAHFREISSEPDSAARAADTFKTFLLSAGFIFLSFLATPLAAAARRSAVPYSQTAASSDGIHVVSRKEKNSQDPGRGRRKLDSAFLWWVFRDEPTSQKAEILRFGKKVLDIPTPKRDHAVLFP